VGWVKLKVKGYYCGMKFQKGLVARVTSREKASCRGKSKHIHFKNRRKVEIGVRLGGIFCNKWKLYWLLICDSESEVTC
jgi:hypothetical protein